jgi:hypothetical protein
MNSLKPIIYTAHAATGIREREIERRWVERTAREPEWSTSDPGHVEVERRFRLIPERDDRILRVAVVETPEEIRIITAFLDRRARKPI